MPRSTAITVTRWIFILAALYGIPVFGSWFFIEPKMILHAYRQQPEIYCGFAAIGLAWQAVFILIATDPLRYRPLMLLAAIGEKLFFTTILIVLLARHIAMRHWIPPAAIDGFLGLLFIFAFAIIGRSKRDESF